MKRRIVCAWKSTVSMAAFVPLAGGAVMASTWKVPADFGMIQAAIDAAGDGDVVLVSPGTYGEALHFDGKAITVQSTAPEDSATVATTVVDPVSAASVVRFDAGEGLDSQLLGFTLTGGRGTVYRVGPWGGGSRAGGGIYCENASPTIAHCVIRNNTVNSGNALGGGIYGYYSSATVEDCRIDDNYGSNGGATYFTGASQPLFRSCVVVDNRVNQYGSSAGIYGRAGADVTLEGCVIRANHGSGVFCSDASPILFDCRIEGNEALFEGGGVSVVGDAVAHLERCWIEGNSAPNGGGISCKKGFYAPIPELTLYECSIVGNYASSGAGLWLNLTVATIEKCSLIDNAAANPASAAIHWTSGSSVGLQDCILWDADEEEIVPDSGGLTVDYCDLDGGWLSGTGNLDADPRFCDASCGVEDLHLAADSPCLGAAHDGGDIGAWGQGCEEPLQHQPTVLNVPGEYATVADGIAAACVGDTVRLAPGVYTESGLGYEGKAIVLAGSAPLDSAVVAATMVDGGGAAGPVFHFDHAEPASAVLLGITVTGGSASKGAGILCESASPTISHCIIRDNHAVTVAGAFSTGGGVSCAESANVLIQDCVFEGNSASWGGAVHCVYATLQLERCTIKGNSAGLGGGFYAHGVTSVLQDCVFNGNNADGGGGLFLSASGNDCTVIGCDFRDNAATGDGGAMKLGDSTADLVISGVRYVGNSAGDGGGALYCVTPAVVRNSLFLRNSASGRGGGAIISYVHEGLLFENCTFSDNQAGSNGGVYYSLDDFYASEMRNCILWGNSAPEIVLDEGAILDMSYSLVHGGWVGEGNIDADPLFAPQRAGFEGLLRPGSPGVDSGDPAANDEIYDTYPGWPAWFPDGARADMGAYGGPENGVWLGRVP
jgi:hypothetical protein